MLCRSLVLAPWKLVEEKELNLTLFAIILSPHLQLQENPLLYKKRNTLDTKKSDNVMDSIIYLIEILKTLKYARKEIMSQEERKTKTYFLSQISDPSAEIEKKAFSDEDEELPQTKYYIQLRDRVQEIPT